MKRISYEDWFQKYDVVRPVDNDPAEYSQDERDFLTFYDNGAVMNADGDYIIKCDQVRRRL